MVYWPQINVEAPIVRAFLDRNLNTAANVITIGSLGGPDERDAGDAAGPEPCVVLRWRRMVCCRTWLLCGAIHPRFRTPWKGTILAGFLAAIVGSVTPIDDIGKMVNIGTLFRVCYRLYLGDRAAVQGSGPGTSVQVRLLVPLIPILGILFNGYMMVELGAANWIRLVVWLIIGLFVYFFYSRKHSRVQAALERTTTV